MEVDNIADEVRQSLGELDVDEDFDEYSDADAAFEEVPTVKETHQPYEEVFNVNLSCTSPLKSASPKSERTSPPFLKRTQTKIVYDKLDVDKTGN